MIEKLSESVMDKVSIDFLRDQVLKNAYGNDDTPIAALDPRVLLLWYLFFGIVPWFLNDVVVLLGFFVLTVVTTRVARVAPLVLAYIETMHHDQLNGTCDPTSPAGCCSLEDPFGGDLDTYRRCRDKLCEELQRFQRYLGF